MLAKRNASREDLQLAAAGSRVPGVEEVRSLPRPDDGYVSMVWPRDGFDPLPVLIIVPGREQRVDLLAWVATYLDALSPFTAFCRVVDSGTEKHFAPSAEPDPALLAAAIAMVLAEAGALADQGFTVRDCFATQSYALGRALMMGWHGPVLASVADAYSRATARSENLPRAKQARQFDGAWSVLTELVGSGSYLLFPRTRKDALVSVVQELHRSGTLSVSAIRTIVPDVRRSEDVARLSAWPMEDRVAFFADLSRDVGPRLSHDANVAFLLGYALSQVSGGSLEHYRLADRVGIPDSGILQWYALCVGLAGARGSARFAASPVAFRVWRELVRPFDLMTRPRCDVSWDELELHSEAERALGRGLPGSIRGLSNALVELAPGVEITVSIAPPGSHGRQVPLPSSDDPRSDPLTRLGYHLGEAQLALSELRRGSKKPRGQRS